MIRDLDRVVLTAPVLAHDLKVGDVGTVVHVYGDGEALEVEFVPRDGRTTAVATLEASVVQEITSRE